MDPDRPESAGERRRARLDRARLYLILEPKPPSGALDEIVSEALAGGVDAVQLREKGGDERELIEAGRRVRPLCDEQEALLIVNDRPDLALSCEADGVHLGQDDLPVDEARAIVGPDLLIGLSTHSPEEVAAGFESAADYVGVGPVFATPTKPSAAPVGTALVRHAAASGARPFFAIGGIDAGNVREVAAAGASRVAVVRAIRDAEDPRRAAALLRSALELEAPAGAAR